MQICTPRKKKAQENDHKAPNVGLAEKNSLFLAVLHLDVIVPFHLDDLHGRASRSTLAHGTRHAKTTKTSAGAVTWPGASGKQKQCLNSIVAMIFKFDPICGSHCTWRTEDKPN